MSATVKELKGNDITFMRTDDADCLDEDVFHRINKTLQDRTIGNIFKKN